MLAPYWKSKCTDLILCLFCRDEELIGNYPQRKKYGDALQLALQQCPPVEDGEDAAVSADSRLHINRPHYLSLLPCRFIAHMLRNTLLGKAMLGRFSHYYDISDDVGCRVM